MDKPPTNDTGEAAQLFVLPKWLNTIRPAMALGLAIAPVYVAVVVAGAIHPQSTDVGYAPKQPVPYSHRLHAGELGIDCRYCHTTVDQSRFASIPPTSTCMNCHANIKVKDSPNLEKVRESYETGMPIEWIRVHDLPDFAYFNHSAHVRRGVGCASCHGRVDTMEVVHQAKSLSMGWCLDCHRNPLPHLRPLSEITNMGYDPTADESTIRAAREVRDQYNINPSTNCSTCHR